MMKNEKRQVVYRYIANVAILLVVFILMLPLTACERNVENKKLIIQTSIGELNGKYTGKLVDGEPTGSGTLSVLDEEGDLYKKYQIKDKTVLSGEYYFQKLKHRQYFFDEVGNIKNGKWFNQNGNVIWESKLTDKGYPELIVKDSNPNFCNASDTTKFTKSNLWKFYAGFCDIIGHTVLDDGCILYEAYITDIRGNCDYNRVSFYYWPDEDDPRYGMDDIISWKGQLLSVEGENPEIEAYEFYLIRKSR